MKKMAALLATALMLMSCEYFKPEITIREETRFSDVMLCYFAAFNNLASPFFMEGNLKDLLDGEHGVWAPGINEKKALLVYMHSPQGSYTVSDPTPAYLMRIYSDRNGKSVCDTIWKSDVTTIASREALEEVTRYVHRNFKSDRYGIVFSSHGTGWMPQGTYDTEPRGDESWWLSFNNRYKCGSFGQEWVKGTNYYIDIDDLPGAIDMHLDYIIFDACLMGGVETVYELRNTADLIGISQCEVMGSGFMYRTMAERLLRQGPDGPLEVMKDAFDMYDKQSGSSRTSAVSLIDCSGLENLARECAVLFEKYRSQIAAVNPDLVQGYFTSTYHWFYDLEDILVQSGIPDSELAGVREALDGCVLYKAATPMILNKVKIRTHCGLSMYLPCNGSTNLDEYYRTLMWNEATSLVK